MYIKTGFLLIRRIEYNESCKKKIQAISNNIEYQFHQWDLVLFGIKNESFSVKKEGLLTEIEIGNVLHKTAESLVPSFGGNTGNNIVIKIYKENKKIELYRDPLGVNEVYYNKKGVFYTNSIHLALCIHNKIEINNKKLAEYLSFRHIIGSETIYSGILRALPGHYLEITKDSPLIKKYFELEYRPEKRPYTYWRKKTISILKENIAAITLKSDAAQIGLLLSRGVDSNILLGISDNSSIRTLTGDFLEKGYEEAIESGILSNQEQKKNAYTRLIKFDDFYPEIPKVIQEYGMPLHMPNMVSYSLLYKDAHEKGIRYLISGEGADGLFGGISFFKPAKLFALPLSLRRLIARGGKIVPESLNQLLLYGKKNKLINLLNQDFKYALISAHLYTDLSKTEKILTKYENPLIDRVHIYDAVQEKEDNRYNIINKYYIYVSLSEDPRFMTHLARAKNVELYYPFLQENVIDLISKIPIKYKFKGNTTKYILKDICTDFLPHRMVYNRKSGFGVPLEKWMYNKDWHDDIVENVFNIKHDEFDRKGMASLKEEFISKKIKDHEYEGLIWTLYSYCIWKKQIKGLQSL